MVILICLKGKSSSIRKLLIDTREQLAYGMIKAEVHDVSDECVWVWIYIGKADMDEWLEIHRNEENTVEFERSDLDGEAWKMGYSMATRNQVIEALKG